MQKIDFTEAVDRLTESEPRFHRDAFFFLREALDYTVKLRKRQLGESGHVNGAQLCEGIRQLAIKQFGPMVPTVFSYWGLQRTDDFGDMVWMLIELGVFGKTDSDSRADFRNVYEFETAFVEPYRPAQILPRESETPAADDAPSKRAAA
jgi:uncharacterized repeat protein (TIGR04138 family)